MIHPSAAARPATDVPTGRPIHVVQLGYDDSVFAPDAASDTVARQLAYARALDAQVPGSRLALLSVTTRAEPREFALEGMRFVPMHAPRARHLLPRLYQTLERLHAERPIDVVASQTVQEDGWVALAFGRRRGVPVVGQLHYDLFSPHAREEHFGGSAIGRARYTLSLRSLRRFPALRVVGERLRAELVARGYAGRVEVLPVPVTMDDAGAGPDRRGRDGGGPVVLFVGRLVTSKNLDLWLEVASRVRARRPDARFEIVGDGPLRAALEERAAVLGLAGVVSFPGAIPYQGLAARYRSAALLLLTSHYEGFGRVAVEAGRFGLPVVATRVTGLEDIVEPGVTGELCAPDDADGLAASVTSLLDDDAARLRYGEAAARRVRAIYDPTLLAQRWMRLLTDVARRPHA